MSNQIKISTSLPNKTKIEYDVILTFKSQVTNKNYIIYTDNNYDQNNKLRVFAATYNPTNNSFIEEPTTTSEWNEITTVLDRVLLVGN